MADLFSGAQGYMGLKRRLWGQVGVTFSEVIDSLVHPQSGHLSERTATGADSPQ